MHIRKIAVAISLAVATATSGALAYHFTGDRTVKHCLEDPASQKWYCSKSPVDRENGTTQPPCQVDQLGWWCSQTAVTVYCPTEDSCTADYRDGAWHIEPVKQ